MGHCSLGDFNDEVRDKRLMSLIALNGALIGVLFFSVMYFEKKD